MKSWTSILAAIYNTLATFRDLQPDPNASQKGVHNAFGIAEPPYHKRDLNSIDFVSQWGPPGTPKST